MTAVATPDAARLVFAAVAGLILLLILIIKFKVHAMISILIGAVGIGLMAGMPLSDIIGSVNEGIGNTLKGIALLVGLGSMFGAILEESGGAQTLAVTMVRKSVTKRPRGHWASQVWWWPCRCSLMQDLSSSFRWPSLWQSAPSAPYCTTSSPCWPVWRSATPSSRPRRVPFWWLPCWALTLAGSSSSASSAASLP